MNAWERGEGVGQDICHEHFASGPRIEQLVYAPECWTSLTPGNCSAKTSCNFSLTNLKWLGHLCAWPLGRLGHCLLTRLLWFLQLQMCVSEGPVRNQLALLKLKRHLWPWCEHNSGFFFLFVWSTDWPWNWCSMINVGLSHRETISGKFLVCFYWRIVAVKALGSFLILCPWVSTFSLHLCSRQTLWYSLILIQWPSDDFGIVCLLAAEIGLQWS